MLPQFLAFACLSFPTLDAPAAMPAACLAAASEATLVRPGEEKAVRALDAWLKLYRSGKIDYRSKTNITKESLAMKFGLAPKTGLGNPTWAGDLELILGDLAKLDTAEAAEAMLEVAAIGLDQGKATYTVEMAPYEVRAAAEKFVVKFTSAEVKETFAKAVRGELKVEKSKAAAMRAAGVHCLGLLKDAASRPLIENALGDGDELVRIQACESLAMIGDDASALPLVETMKRDNSDAVLTSVVQALNSLYAKYLPKSAPSATDGGKDKSGKDAPSANEPVAKPTPVPAPESAAKAGAELPESVRLAVRAAIGALGRTTWRADMALIRLLDDFRSPETVPALIAVLERFAANPDDVKSGKTSGLLLYQAHELLVRMTGAVIPADQPAKWRELWERDKDKIVVTQKREPKEPAATAAGGFCGIPVQGTRVVFVLDLSGSMDWPMDEPGTDGKKSRSIRLDFAKRELNRAVDELAPNAMFTLITFNGDDKADQWSKDLVVATPQTRERFKHFVNQLKARGGTNLWSALEAALKIKSLVYGNHYTTNIDELFVLSDGAPTVGEVTDGIEILRLVEECNRFASVRINTIFISSATPPEYANMDRNLTIAPKDLMKTMAQKNGGQFRNL